MHRRVEVGDDLLADVHPGGLAQFRIPLDAGVVHEHIELGKLARGPITQRAPVRFRCDVDDACHQLGMRQPGGLELVLPAAADDDAAAGAKKPLRERKTDARRRR